MAKKRARPKRKTRKSARRQNLTVQLLKIFGGLALLVLLVFGAGVLAYFFIQQPAKSSIAAIPPGPRLPAPQVKAPKEKPAYEVFPQKGVPPKPLSRLQPLPGDVPPVIAIILDDIGYDRQMSAQFLKLEAPLTFSMLPFGPFSRTIMAEARAQGHEIMLHLPMEPNEYPDIDPGPGALLTQMSPDQLIAQLKKNIEQLPGLKGVNNHMGSRMTASPGRMRQIFSILKKQGLYYIDSRTTADTVARGSANLLQVPFAERDIFIDHFDDPAFIRDQLKRLIKRAQQQGYAIGIAHPHANTYQALKEFLPLIKEKVQLVPASMVVQAAQYAETGKRRAQR